jgi:hypothetical protein
MESSFLCSAEFARMRLDLPPERIQILSPQP